MQIGLYLLAISRSIAVHLEGLEIQVRKRYGPVYVISIFLLVLYFVACSVVRLDSIVRVFRVFVLSGAVYGFLAVVERQTGWTPFNRYRIFSL